MCKQCLSATSVGALLSVTFKIGLAASPTSDQRKAECVEFLASFKNNDIPGLGIHVLSENVLLQYYYPPIQSTGIPLSYSGPTDSYRFLLS
jgi:hypothetical protein